MFRAKTKILGGFFFKKTCCLKIRKIYFGAGHEVLWFYDDSDSIDIDVLATFSAKSFAASTGVSPPADSSMDSLNGFSVLMKKPLTKTPTTSKEDPSTSPTPTSPPNDESM